MAGELRAGKQTDLWLMAGVASCLAVVLPVKVKAAQDTGMKLTYGGINGKQQEILGFHALFHNSLTARPPRRYCVITKAAPTPSYPNSKPNSVICADCHGNGAVLCSQCKGSGVNSVDFFNGQFKAGDSCWLCGGKKDMLCGNCNGAGFIGGFMSTFDE